MKDALFGVILEFSALMLLAAVAGGVIGWLIADRRRRRNTTVEHDQRSFADERGHAVDTQHQSQGHPPQGRVLPDDGGLGGPTTAAPPTSIDVDPPAAHIVDEREVDHPSTFEPPIDQVAAPQVDPHTERPDVSALPVADAEAPTGADAPVIRVETVDGDVTTGDETVVVIPDADLGLSAAEPDEDAGADLPVMTDADLALVTDADLALVTDAGSSDVDIAEAHQEDEDESRTEVGAGLPVDDTPVSQPTDPERDRAEMNEQQTARDADFFVDLTRRAGVDRPSAYEQLSYEQLYDEWDDQVLDSVVVSARSGTDGAPEEEYVPEEETVPGEESVSVDGEESGDAADRDHASQMETLQQQMAELRDELHRKDMELMRLETGATAAWDRTVPDLQNRIDELRSDNDRLTSELRQARNHLDSVFSELGRARSSQGQLLPAGDVDEGGA